MQRTITCLLGLGVLAGLSCSGVSYRDAMCTLEMRPALIVEIRDAHTGAAAHERAGIYSIELVHPGYASWTASGVRVENGAYHLQTVTLHASLTPS